MWDEVRITRKKLRVETSPSTKSQQHKIPLLIIGLPGPCKCWALWNLSFQSVLPKRRELVTDASVFTLGSHAEDAWV